MMPPGAPKLPQARAARAEHDAASGHNLERDRRRRDR